VVKKENYRNNVNKYKRFKDKYKRGFMHKKVTDLAICFCFLLLATTCYCAEQARKIVVATDGSGNFTSIAEAIASIKDAIQASPVDIIIKEGTYKEMITTKNWVNLIGEDREKCIVSYDSGTEKDVHKYHTVWATSNSKIKNLTLIGQTVKYVIHSDGGGNYILTIENCILRREYPTEDSKKYSAGFGVGLRANQHIVMKDCVIDANLPIYMHNWNKQSSSCSMTLEKCSLKGQDYAIHIGMLGSQQRDFFVIHDSTLIGSKASIDYKNYRDIKGTTWYGDNEITVTGSGNGNITGAEFRDDSQKRQSGVELTAPAKIVKKPDSSVRLEEKYGTGQGRLQVSKAWLPVKIPGPYGMSSEYAADCLVLTCTAEGNPKPFSYAGGPGGSIVEAPMMMELSMKCAIGEKGLVQLYYCVAPDCWLIEWRPGKVVDANNPTSGISVDTANWQTYRLVARNSDDVQLFVDGIPQGIALKKGKHNAKYFQLRVNGHGNKAMIDRFLLTGILPVE
jgi:hypothetical protein